MKLKRDTRNQRILITDDFGKVCLEIYFIPSFLLWEFHTNDPIVIDKDIDESFYHNLTWLMNNSYEFPHEYSKKSKDELIWFCEQCIDIESEEARDMTTRLVIKRINDEFHISSVKPFFDKNNINRFRVVTFSPGGHGFLSKNIETGLSLQDDMGILLFKTLNERKINDASLKLK